LTRRRGGRILPAMVALLLALLGVACASAATLAWRLVVFHERLRALEVGQAATSARVLALAPAQVDALDAAISARLALLDAAAEPAEALRALAELRSCGASARCAAGSASAGARARALAPRRAPSARGARGRPVGVRGGALGLVRALARAPREASCLLGVQARALLPLASSRVFAR